MRRALLRTGVAICASISDQNPRLGPAFPAVAIRTWEVACLGRRVLINAQIAAPLRLSKKLDLNHVAELKGAPVVVQIDSVVQKFALSHPKNAN